MYDPIWVTRDGRRMRVGEMHIDHLKNCIAKITRSRRGWRAHWLPRLLLELDIRSLPGRNT